MFSLADQIQKFQKIILTMPDNVMTIDERFLGGGIKMQDLIQENGFIINQMRKFKGVFLNYCKLNDKIYKKIIQHEVNANEHLNKMVTLSSSMDRRIQMSDQEMKKIKEDIFMQMSKLKEYVQTNINNIKEGWNKKIDQKDFTSKVIQVIQQYDTKSVSLKAEDIELKNQGGDLSQPSQQNSIVKKRRGLTIEDIENFKSQITPLIDEVRERVDKQGLTISQCSNTLQINKNKIKKLECQTKWNSEDIASMKKQIQQMKIYVNTEDKKVLEAIRQAINENIWTQRFQNFNNSVLVPSLEKTSIRLQNYIQILKKELDQQIRPKIKDNYLQIQRIREKQKQIQLKTTKIQQRMVTVGSKLQEIRQQLIVQIENSGKNTHKLLHDQSVEQKKQVQKVGKQTMQVSKRLNEIVDIIQEEVLKKVQHKLGKEMKQMRGDITVIHQKTNQINNNVKFNKQQVNHVKDVVATKANYTDLIMYFDKKADKEQFKQLQQLFADSPKQSKFGTINNESLNQRRQTEDYKKRKSPLSKRNTAPLVTRPEQQSGKYMLIGWQSPQKSRQIIKSTIKNSINNGSGKNKNRSIRPSTANTMFKI